MFHKDDKDYQTQEEYYRTLDSEELAILASGKAATQGSSSLTTSQQAQLTEEIDTIDGILTDRSK